MFENNGCLTKERREEIFKILNTEYVIPGEYRKCIKRAIIKYRNSSSLKEEVIKKYISEPQKLSKFVPQDNSGGEFYQFSGKIAEWLVCAEYNMNKNLDKNVVLTIVNPDPHSKADLLHIIATGNGFIAEPGPDVKSGQIGYLYKQWVKNIEKNNNVPMVDFYGELTTEGGLRSLSKTQRLKFDDICKQHPKKHPISTTWSKLEFQRIKMDYLKFLKDGASPCEATDDSFKYSIENAKLIKSGIKNNCRPTFGVISWADFAKRCCNLPKAAQAATSKSTDRMQSSMPSKGKESNHNSHTCSNIGSAENTGGCTSKTMLAKIGDSLLNGTIKVVNFAVEHQDAIESFISSVGEAKSHIDTFSNIVDKSNDIVYSTPIFSPSKVGASDVVTESTPAGSTNLSKRNSPRLHEVDGHTRNHTYKDGSIGEIRVKGYERGNKKD